MNIPECGFARRDFLRVTGVAGLALGFNLHRCLAEALRSDCGVAGAEAEMPIKELIVGLEIGASKVCAVVGGRQFDDKIRIFGVGQARSRGMRGGRIVAYAKGCIGAAGALANPRYSCAIGLVKVDPMALS